LAVEFLLTSWLYAFFCFDYKWGLRRQPFAARIAYFEAHWAFFGGFGAACTLPALVLPYYQGAAVMGLLFPLFILLAADASPHDSTRTGSSPLEQATNTT
jgi:etoposide-induced 2.4 mRNA